jgi:hypothetical protein
MKKSNFPAKSPQKTLRSDKHFRKVAGYKINIQNSVAFLCSSNEHAEQEIRKANPFTTASKNT